MPAKPPPNSVHPLTRAAWREWLEQNHNRAEGVWVISYKKATGKPRFEYEVAVEEALCFGWIDSKPNKLDEERSMLRHAALVRSRGERALGHPHHGQPAFRVSHRIGRAL